jgi:predicted glycosyltransferase involved in capsule biosynthesis
MNRAAARNDAFKKSTGDILIINDADTFCNQSVLDLAVDMVNEDARTWVIPFDVYYNLTQDFTDELLDGPEIHTPLPSEVQYDHRITHVEHPPEGSVAGVLVVPRAAYEATDGYDERFKGWGYEDDSQAWKWDHEWYPHKRLAGPCYHLWHPPAVDGDFKNPHIDENRRLFKEIKRG